MFYVHVRCTHKKPVLHTDGQLSLRLAELGQRADHSCLKGL